METDDLPFRGAHGSLLSRLQDAASGGTVMADFNLTLVLLPLVPALSFMLWVIWALEKQIKRERRQSEVIARAKAGTDRPAPANKTTEQRVSSPSLPLQFGREAH